MGTFNTIGELKNTPAPTKAKAETGNPDPAPKPAEIEALDALQMLLDVVGLVPALGAPADILNGLISAGRGDFFGAALSFLGAVPIAGEAATVGKIAKNSEKYVQALEIVAKKIMPNLPPSAQKKLQEAIDAAKKKIDDIAGKKPPKKEPEPPPKKKDKEGEDGAKAKKRNCKHLGKGPQEKNIKVANMVKPKKTVQSDNAKVTTFPQIVLAHIVRRRVLQFQWTMLIIVR